jgi:hypothetical protein
MKHRDVGTIEVVLDTDEVSSAVMPLAAVRINFAFG